MVRGHGESAQAKLWARVVAALIVAYPVIVITGGVLESGDEPFLGGLTWQSLLYSVWEQFLCIGIVVALGVWFRERFNHQGRLAANMGADSYAVYIFHPFVIVPLAFVLGGTNHAGAAEVALGGAAGAGALFPAGARRAQAAGSTRCVVAPENRRACPT